LSTSLLDNNPGKLNLNNPQLIKIRLSKLAAITTIGFRMKAFIFRKFKYQLSRKWTLITKVFY